MASGDAIVDHGGGSPRGSRDDDALSFLGAAALGAASSSLRLSVCSACLGTHVPVLVFGGRPVIEMAEWVW